MHTSRQSGYNPRTVAILGAIVFGVTTAAKAFQDSPPAFEVASVKSDKSQGVMDLGGANEKFHALRISLKGLIEYAYDINSNQIVGSARLESETYDIEAKPAHPVSVA